MPLLRKGVAMPVKGVDFSVPSTFIGDQYGFTQNMMFSKGQLRKRPGKTLQGQTVEDGSPIMGYGKLELPGNLKFLIRASQRRLQNLNTGTGNWDDIASTLFTGGNTDFFDFANVTESLVILITNGFDKIRKWTGSGNASVLGGNPPLAKYMTYISPYPLIANLVDGGTDYPWAVDWPDTSNYEDWSGGNSGRALLTDEPSPIQNIKKLNDFAAAYKKESLVLGRKVDPPDIWKFETIYTGIGLAAPRALVDFEGKHAFMGFTDFYAWNGIRPESIGGAVRDEVFSRIDPDKYDRCFAIHVQQLREIWFFIVVVGESWPTEVWKYRYDLGWWYGPDTCDQLTAALRWERSNTIVWDQAVGTWDSQQIPWNSASTVDAWEEIMLGDKFGKSLRLDHTTVNDSGQAISGYYITKDFVGEDLEVKERWLQFDCWVGGPGKLYLDYSTDFGSNWTNIPFDPSTGQLYADIDSVIVRKVEWYFDVVADHIRFRLRNAETGETMIIESLCPYFQKQEEAWTKR